MANPFLSEFDLHLFAEGTHGRLFDKWGAHGCSVGGVAGVQFSVWAPHARRVAVIGDCNGWNEQSHPMEPIGASGSWTRFIPGVSSGALYKYLIESNGGGRHYKADPFALAAELRPGTASRVWDLAGYNWGDAEWLRHRSGRNSLHAPISVYEIHLGSWMRVPEEGDRWLGYRELAPKLADYIHHLGFTHVEFLPILEHPFDGSWGYQPTGYFAPTSRFGTPQELMFLIDTLHRRGIGVILDWVPGHFPRDEHGLGLFDGTPLYEYADPRMGLHPEWDTFVFDFGKAQVRNFLINSALFWIERYHIDGLRVDAVASMLYLDYARKSGEWLPNRHGGNENFEAIAFLQSLNERVHAEFPGVLTIAEESTAWPNVSRPVEVGGLGFDLKWDMGWMHDSLKYFGNDPVHRKHHHHELTFRQVYAHNENYLLPLSHDEVVHGKRSLLGRMPGDRWQQFADLRLLFGYMFAQPGKKMMFMGDELGQLREWNHDRSLDWHLLEDPLHRGLQRWIRDLNTQYRAEPALHELDCEPAGFQWIDCNDSQNSVLSMMRRDRAGNELLFVCNFTPVPRSNYLVGVPRGGRWVETLNSDAELYGGSGQGNIGGVSSSPVFIHGHSQALTLLLPPLAMIVLRVSS